MDIILSLLINVATAFVKPFGKAAAHYVIKRIKDRTALSANKDGSDDTV